MAYGNNSYGSVPLGGEVEGVTSISVSDTMTGVELLSLLNKIPQSDTGTGSDIVSLLTQLAISDNIIGVDTATTRGFEYGLTDSYGSDVHTDGSYETGAYVITINNLFPGASYHCRSYATNVGGTAYGDDVEFTMKASPFPVFYQI